MPLRAGTAQASLCQRRCWDVRQLLASSPSRAWLCHHGPSSNAPRGQPIPLHLLRAYGEGPSIMFTACDAAEHSKVSERRLMQGIGDVVRSACLPAWVD